MGQIKNIKLHIVTDIKLSIIQWIIKMAVREEREGIIYDNPEKFYDIEASEIGFGKMAKVAVAKSKTDGKTYAAKMIYFDDDTRFAVREFDLMKSGKLNHNGLVQLHEAYMVRKYLILILDFVEGKTLLDQFKGRHSATEDDVAFIIGELCETLNFLHQQNIVHLDLRPTNIRFEGRDIKLLDYNSSRHLANKKAGVVVDVIGDTEFCAPEMTSKRKVISLLQSALDEMEETDARLLEEESEDYVEASFVFRTFEEDEYESPEEESEEEE